MDGLVAGRWGLVCHVGGQTTNATSRGNPEGRWLHGRLLGGLGIGVVAAAFTPDSRFVYMLGGLAFAGIGIGIGIGIALPVAEPASWWDRLNSVDAVGNRLLTAQPKSHRRRHAVLGIPFGLLPGPISIGVDAAILGDSEELLTIGMMGMGLMLVGAVVGGIIGFNWGSREAATINRAPQPPQRWISEDRQSLETE